MTIYSTSKLPYLGNVNYHLVLSKEEYYEKLKYWLKALNKN